MVLQDSGLTLLCKGLKVSKNLAYLNISKNEITDTRMTDLIEALKNNDLADLDISKNAIGDAGVR